MFSSLAIRRIIALIVDVVIILGCLDLFDVLDCWFELPDGIGWLLIGSGAFLTAIFIPLQEAIWEQTIGKRITGLKVVKTNGETISYLRAFLRYYLRFLTIVAAPVSLILIFIRGRSITDMIAGTKVISTHDGQR